MQIPRRLAYILERDQALDGAVKFSISQVEPWITNSLLPFFPEYTKHDISHIEAVLRTASGLIRDEAWEAFTPSDAAVLILAVLLHDCTMHLTEDGFISIITSDRSQKSIPGMGDKPWSVLWEEFYGEASRFDGRKLIRLFGDSQPVRRPPLQSNALTKRDRLLIGEFLRKHHPRLAQEIALLGVPTLGPHPLVLQGLVETNQHIAQLAGIVARSHGSDVRSHLGFLRDHFDIRQYKNVHAVILMTLLRVADYVQIDAERAPAQVLQIRQLSSPVSAGEWKAHHAIKDIRNTHEDPEALFIDANPPDISTFLRVKSWLSGIQQELDASWAVLGEVYGRYEGLNKLGLVLRRIRSSLDDEVEFGKKARYLPIKAMFRAADADLLKLLIEPLYGARPEVGLRELIQNAVDACRELAEYRKDIPNSILSQSSQDEDVVVTVEKTNSNETWITVSDKGIGMTPQIVVDYFLAAGASFRRSDEWRKAFETKEGRSKVLRAGRFGVGALASFLIGPEIEVSSRHIDEARGLCFKASVESDAIELLKCDRPTGTTIKIRVQESIVADLSKVRRYSDAEGSSWDWYCLAKPSVARILNGEKLVQKYVLPAPHDQLHGEWHRIDHNDFDAILWTYSDAPPLVCNGIKVGTSVGDQNDVAKVSHSWSIRSGLRLPALTVFDPDGKLPLNLQRTGLVEERYSFEEQLLKDVCRDYLAFALVYGPVVAPSSLEMVEVFRRFIYKGSNRIAPDTYTPSSKDWYFTSIGFGYLDASTIGKREDKSALVVRAPIEVDGKIEFTTLSSQIVIPVIGSQSLMSQDWWIREMLEYGLYAGPHDGFDFGRTQGGAGVFHSLKRKGVRILLSKASVTRARGGKLPKFLRDRWTEEWTSNGWHLLRIGECPKSDFDFESFVRIAGERLNAFCSVSEVYLDRGGKTEESPMARAWQDVLKADLIPFDPARRRDELRNAYAELATYIDLHVAQMQDDGKDATPIGVTI